MIARVPIFFSIACLVAVSSICSAQSPDLSKPPTRHHDILIPGVFATKHTAVTPSEQLLATQTGGKVYVFDPKKLDVIDSIWTERTNFGPVCFAPDGKTIFVAIDGELREYRNKGEVPKRTFREYENDIKEVHWFTSDPKHLIIEADGLLRWHDLETGTAVRQFKLPKAFGFIFNNDGTLFAAYGRDSEKYRIDVFDSESLKRIDGAVVEPFRSLVFSPDSKSLYVAIENDIIKISRGAGIVTQKFAGHLDTVRDILVTRDDRYLISCGDDKIVKNMGCEIRQSRAKSSRSPRICKTLSIH